MRAKLLALFIAMAVLDAVGKIAERNEMALHDVRAAAQRLGIRVRARGSHSGNFDIFRNSSRHLVAGADLYAHYPNETRDRFKYSPTFALFFAPLSYVPWGLALLLWQLLNALALFYALTRLLPDKTADLAIAFVSLEVWRSMQNSQSNALVAATIILAFVALEKRKEVAAATWIVLGAAIKIFPLIAGVFALPKRSRWRFAAILSSILLVAVALPALVTGPRQLWMQYASWTSVEEVDARAHMLSVMGFLDLIPPLGSIPNVVVQITGLAVLLLAICRRPGRWNDRLFRLLALASTLLYVVLFNHQAERSSYVIAFTGVVIWYLSSRRGMLDDTIFAAACLCIPIASLFIPGRWVRSPDVMVVRLVVPALAIWITIQVQMLRGRYGVAIEANVTDPAGALDYARTNRL